MLVDTLLPEAAPDSDFQYLSKMSRPRRGAQSLTSIVLYSWSVKCKLYTASVQFFKL